MCIDPASVFMIATVASSAVGAYASIQSGNAQYQAGMYNAQIAERNAQAVEEEKGNVQDAAAIERRRLGLRVQAEKGQEIAAAAAMGIDPAFGTPADLVGDLQQSYMIDRSILGKNEINSLKQLDKQQADFIDSAAMSRAGGKHARKAGLLGAAGSLLDGAGAVAGHWIKPSAPLASGQWGPKPITAKTLGQPSYGTLSPYPTSLLPIGAD